MYFEIYKSGNLIKRGTNVIGGISWTNALMEVPTMDLTLPIEYLEVLSGWEDFKVFVNGKCFWGIVVKIIVDKVNETVQVTLYHKIHEWTFRQISINNAVKDKKVNIVYKGSTSSAKGGDNVTASDFTMLQSEVASFTAKKYITRAGASGWKSNGETLPVTVSSKAEQKDGEYNVTFKAGKASVTVKATVRGKESSTERDGYTLSASSFAVSASKVFSSDLVKLANAKCTPSLPVKVDSSSLKAVDGTYSVKFYCNYGDDKEISVTVTAIVSGSVNSTAAVADNIADIFSDTNFACPGWVMNMSTKAKNYDIDYVYSRQNKLDALTRTCELTDNLFWRVRFVNEKVVDVSEFGARKDFIISTKPEGPNNIQMIDDPEIEYDFENVVNLMTVYSAKSDSGMAALTLREVHNDPSLQKDGFPVVILRSGVNNERDYSFYTQYPKLAPNNELEFAVIDEESVVMENGTVIEGTTAYNDLAPISLNDEVTDKDRIESAVKVYEGAIRSLKQKRRRYMLNITTTPLPIDINPGDRVRLLYSNSLYITDACTPYWKRILSYDDYFYVTETRYTFENGVEVCGLTLEKEIRTLRDDVR